MSPSALLFWLLISMSWVFCKKTEENNDVEWRLPNNVRPLNYQIHIHVSDEALTETSNKYHGEVNIEVIAVNSTSIIKLHASNDYLSLEKVSVISADLEKKDYSIDSRTDILSIWLPFPLPKNHPANIIIEFSGLISTTDMLGFYKSSYVTPDGKKRYQLVTQMEPIDARKVFPCFDEPSFKSTFEIYITYPIGYNALSNTPGTLQSSDSTSETMRFEKTVEMPVYLVAFVISDFTCSKDETDSPIPIRVCSREETSDSRDFALKIGPKILQELEEYTQIDYNTSMTKVDHIAIPQFASAAMENWGLVTYNEDALLWDPKESSESAKQSVAETMAHEMVHFWFGNLVTCNFWSELFLNEGFAVYLTYLTLQDVLPSWEMDKQFVFDIHKIQVIDSMPTASSLQSEVSSDTEANDKFNLITYFKGGSILRMIYYAIGPEVFRDGVRNYLNEFKYWNTLPEDLWGKFQEITDRESIELPASSLAEVMNNWIKMSGYPLIKVRTYDTYVEITQVTKPMSERYKLKDNQTNWYVPICYTTSQNIEKFACKKADFWLKPTIITKLMIAKEDYNWFIINNNFGYFMVMYDSIGWENIQRALQLSNFDGITDMNRATIINDLFSMAYNDEVPYSVAFDNTKFLANDNSYFTWYTAAKEFKLLIRRVGLESQLGRNLSRYFVYLMDNLYSDMIYTMYNEDNHIFTLKQTLAFETICEFGGRSCILESIALFTTHKKFGSTLNKNLRRTVYCSALKHSRDPSDWIFVYNLFKDSAVDAPEHSMFIDVLGCSQDKKLLKKYFDLSLAGDSGIRIEDRGPIFQAICKGGPIGIKIVSKFWERNFVDFLKIYGSDKKVFQNIIEQYSSTITTKQQYNKLLKLMSMGIPKKLYDSVESFIEKADSNVKWLQKNKQQLTKYFKYKGPSTNGADSFIFHIYYIFLTLICYFVDA